MRLLWIFSSFEIGGAQRRFAALCESLPPSYEHIVTAMNGCYDAAVLLPEGAPWIRADIDLPKAAFAAPRTLRRMGTHLRAHEPDLLLTGNWGTIEWHLANRLGPGAPHIHFEDGFGLDEARGARNRKRDLVRRVLFLDAPYGRNRRAFVAPSHTLERIFLERWRAPKAKVRRIPNGVAIDRFTAADRRPPVGRPLVIGSVGALRPEKRFDRLLRVFAEARKDMNLSLRLVGDGAEAAVLRDQAKALGIAEHVVFAGACADVAAELAQMDVYALTSDTEQAPISLLEAMAAGLPAATTDVGDVALMLSDENRPFVSAPEDERSLAAALRALAANPAKARAVGTANAARAAAEYDAAVMTDRLHSLFQEVAGSSALAA